MSKASKYLNWSLILIIIALSIVLSSCGSKQSPTGGKEDIDKLKLLAVFPEEFAEISEQKVELSFSKAIDRAAFIKGLYLYPAIVNKKIYYEANIITLKFLESLEPDTNYYLTLTTRIKDVRGNTLDKNQTIVFKHGKLQSNRISGNIIYEKPADNGLPVQVNLLSADSVWVMAKNVKGTSYEIEALNPLNYILRAYIDKNLNGRYDADSEPYNEANLEQEPIITYNLNMAYADTVKPVIKSVLAVSNREFEIILNKPIVSYKKITITDESSQQKLDISITSHNADRITLLTAETDSTKLKFELTNATDKKGNVTEQSSMIISASTKPDVTAPQIIKTLPRNGASVNNLMPLLEVTFSEIIPASTFKAAMVEVETNKNIPFEIVKSNSNTYQIQPKNELSNYKTCMLTIEDATADLSGNTIAKDFKLVFLPILRNSNPENP